MAQFSQQEQNAMRREAARRAREMQKRVYFGKHRRRRLVCRCWEIWHSFAPRGSCPDWTVTPC